MNALCRIAGLQRAGGAAIPGIDISAEAMMAEMGRSVAAIFGLAGSEKRCALSARRKETRSPAGLKSG
jgi:hypothetical protein